MNNNIILPSGQNKFSQGIIDLQRIVQQATNQASSNTLMRRTTKGTTIRSKPFAETVSKTSSGDTTNTYSVCRYADSFF